MSYSKTLSLELCVPQASKADKKKIARLSLLAHLEATKNRSRYDQAPSLSKIIITERPGTGRLQIERRLGQTPNNVMTKRRYAMSGNFNIHEDRKLQLSGRTSEFNSRKLTTKDLVHNVVKMQRQLNDLLRLDSCDQAAFKHIISTIEARETTQNFATEFLSTIALSTRKKVESFERAKPISSIYVRNPNVSTPSRETRANSRKKQFTLNIDISNTFEEKLNKFYQFLFIINLSNRIYRGLEIQMEKPLKFFVDKGNNSNLIRNIMARRFWWEQSDKNPSFVWSQIKSPKYLSKQKSQQKCYVDSSFPTKQIQPNQGTFRSVLQSQVHIINKMVFKIISKQDWAFISSQLDGGNGKFLAKTKKIQKYIRSCQDPYNDCIVTNHLPFNGLLGNKKAMFMSLKLYYELINDNVWQYLPQTYHIEDIQDQEFKKFKQSYQKNKNKIWIIKPGQFTNRGTGIVVSDSFTQISRIINKEIGPGATAKDRTFIVQKYIEEPLLYYKRKFDIRAYMLITCSNGILKGYWYEEGYIRTSGHTFGLDDLSNTYKHLTNDAIQKYSENYGKYEKGNKLSYSDFQRYLQTFGHKLVFSRDIYPVMKKIAADAIKSTFLFLDREKLNNNFEIFGLDFMIDNQYKTYLIEINTNPCLETGCPTLDRVIPNMVENAFRIGLDPIFPPPINFPNSKKHYVSQNAIQYNCFQLIFDELIERTELQKKYTENPKSFSRLQEISRWQHNQQVYPCQSPPMANNFTADPMQTI